MGVTKGTYLGEFEQVVLLAAARLAGDAYGMSIRREIQEQTGRDVSIGAVYATLDRLKSKSLLDTTMGNATPQRGGRPKKFFRLTAAGTEALLASRKSMDRLWEGLELEAEEGG